MVLIVLKFATILAFISKHNQPFTLHFSIVKSAIVLGSGREPVHAFSVSLAGLELSFINGSIGECLFTLSAFFAT